MAARATHHGIPRHRRVPAAYSQKKLVQLLTETGGCTAMA